MLKRFDEKLLKFNGISDTKRLNSFFEPIRHVDEEIIVYEMGMSLEGEARVLSEDGIWNISGRNKELLEQVGT